MEELILSKWDEILSLLETEHGLSPIVVKTWIKPLKLYSVEGKKLYFAVDDSMGSRAIDFINKKMYDMFLVTSIKEVLDDDSIEIVIDVESNLNKTSKEEVTKEEYNEAITKSNLYPKYTFDTGIPQTIDWYLNNKEWWENIISGEYKNYFQNMYVDKGRVEE